MPGVGGSSCMPSESPAEAPSAVVPPHGYADFGAYAAKLAHFIQKVPKAELHLHIEGTLEPEMMFLLAARNGVALPYASAEDARKAYDFEDLQSFLDLYYKGCSVLQHEQDFYDLTYAYLDKVASQNVAHVELFFDPQSHLANGVGFATFMAGMKRAAKDAEEKLGVDTTLIMCFLRHLPAEDAMKTLDLALEYKDDIAAVGLDSSELGNPPSKFTEVFKRAQDEGGWPGVAHAGEEGPASYIWDAIRLLKVRRVDHGVRCLEDPELVAYLIETQIAELAKNSFRASFLPDEIKAHYYELVDAQLAIFSAHIDKLTGV
ncbi:MAG: hypothetical protein WDW38_004680 [Sanguina aurantia]